MKKKIKTALDISYKGKGVVYTDALVDSIDEITEGYITSVMEELRVFPGTFTHNWHKSFGVEA